MLDEAVKGKQGERTDLKSNFLYNVQKVQPPTGNTRASGLRKLQKYAQERPDVAEVYERVLSGEMSVNKALLDTGLRKAAAKTIPINTSIDSRRHFVNKRDDVRSHKKNPDWLIVEATHLNLLFYPMGIL